jgi:hypothetical protein
VVAAKRAAVSRAVAAAGRGRIDDFKGSVSSHIEMVSSSERVILSLPP